MSRKPWLELCKPDQHIRMVSPPGMNDGTHVTIEYFTGFELFNTSPYHNHETFSGGYRVTGLGVTAEAEDMDEAVDAWANKVIDGRKAKGGE